MNRIRLFLAGAALAGWFAPAPAADPADALPVVSAAYGAGNTPLHLAVLQGDADAVDALLKSGADAKAVNSAGATPLHYATGSERMVVALLAHGAPVDAVSKMEITPLVCAVLHPDSLAVAKRLVEAGANVNYRIYSEISLVLNNAITGGDRRTVKYLLEHGAVVNPAEGSLPMVTAAFMGDVEVVKLLLEHGAMVNCRDLTKEWQPLSAALFYNQYEIARLLIERGADLKARASERDAPPVVLSAYNDARDPAIARLFVERGIDINSPDENGETALSFALKRGSDSPLVTYLLEAGAKPSATPRRTKTIPAQVVPADPAAREAMVRAGVQRAIDLIQPSSTAFLQVPMVHDQQKCTSCHQQELPNVALALARARGFRIDDHELGRALKALVSELKDHIEEARQGGPNLPLNPLVSGYLFDDLNAYHFPPDIVTDTQARVLLEYQHDEGFWSAPVRRPPMEDGPLVATAWAARVLQLYPPAGRERETAAALSRTRRWLATQPLRDLNDRIFQLMGIAWTNETAERMRPFAEQLMGLQNQDGSWAQFPSLAGDAWATGTALVALNQAGIPPSHPSYRRGVDFLLRTQFDDGSWWVKSRTIPTQNHFNGKFPHGKDQWISAAGTSWAMIALLLTIDPTIDPAKLPTGKELVAAFEAAPEKSKAGQKIVVGTTGERPSLPPGTSAIDFGRDIHPILERSCEGCHSGEHPKGSFNLASRETLLKGGQSGDPGIIPGYADDSQLIQFVSDQVEDLEMPPLNRRKKYPPLSAEEVERLHTWIDAGAPWPAPPRAEKENAPAPTASTEKTTVLMAPGA